MSVGRSLHAGETSRRPPPVFPKDSDDDANLIHQVSRGLPRAVNNLAVQALVAAFGLVVRPVHVPACIAQSG